MVLNIFRLIIISLRKAADKSSILMDELVQTMMLWLAKCSKYIF